jgi:DNA repair exonuclease SbcCD nuclease subunit
MAIKILNAADLHLGKRTSGLDAFGENCATKATWRKMVDFSIENAVDLVLLAGDVVDRDNKYYEASSALQEGFRRLGEKGIDVCLVAGNHDWDVLPQILRNNPFDHVKLLGLRSTWERCFIEPNGERMQIVGRSFGSSVERGNPLIGLSDITVDPDCFSIGLLHADVDNLESPYGPVSLLELQQAPVNVWILGHIHKPTLLSSEKIIRYPGSPQALSAKEQGIHGGLLMQVEGGRVMNTVEVSFSNCRFERLPVNVTGIDSEEGFRRLLETELSEHANDRLLELDKTDYLVYDLLLTGRNSHGLEIESWGRTLKEGYELVLASGTHVHVREISAAIRPTVENLELLARERSPAGILAETILAIRDGRSTPFLEELVRDWNEQFRVVTSSSGFQPLQRGFVQYGNPRQAAPYIMEECNRLLTELLFPNN